MNEKIVVGIPYRPLSATRLKECCEIMIRGNTLLKSFCGPHSITEFRNELLKQDYDCNVVVRGVKIPQASLADILAVKEIEQELLEGHLNLLIKLARSYAIPPHSYSDFLQEAIIGFIRAVYGYDKASVKFITYATHVVVNHLVKAINASKPLSHWTNSDIALHKEYRQARSKFSENASVESVLDTMNISEKKKCRIRSLVSQVFCAVDCASLNEDDEFNDYSVLGRLPNKSDSVDIESDHLSIVAKVGKELEKEGGWDWIVWQAWMESGGAWGWQKKIAGDFINPRTGKPYSRASPMLALNRIKSRIRKMIDKL